MKNKEIWPMKYFWNGKIKNRMLALSTDESGFSLLEIMIALFVFTIFFTAFGTSIGFNLFQSTLMKERIVLKELCQRKINELVISPPAFNPGLTMKPETKKFEDKDIENVDDYTYTIEYKQFKLPDMGKIMGTGKEEGEEEGGGGGAAIIQKKVYGIAKKHMERLIWQAKVTVENKISKNKFTLSTWLYNSKAKVKISI